jgi:hypothetical protein
MPLEDQPIPMGEEIMRCVCRSEDGLSCHTESDGTIRPLPTRGTIGGGELKGMLKIVETLLQSPDVIDVKIVKGVWREQEYLDLEFHTKEGVCANRISSYLVFDEG